jgi:hypothetical protein
MTGYIRIRKPRDPFQDGIDRLVAIKIAEDARRSKPTTPVGTEALYADPAFMRATTINVTFELERV